MQEPKMVKRCFSANQIAILDKVVEISEDIVSNYFKISTSQWKHYRYEIKSLRHLAPEEITDIAYAQILRYIQFSDQKPRGSFRGEYFKICLQDHVILRTLKREKHLVFMPFLTYIVTHELVHVVRFSRFLQKFSTTEEERIAEERLVHKIARDMLRKSKIKGIKETLEFFDFFYTEGEDVKDAIVQDF